ncbi:sugar ABC transporter permease, partial [Sulfolobus sp. B5]
MNTVLLLTLATLASSGRVFLTIGLSILTGWLLGYIAVKNRAFENAYVSLIEVFESVPVISFFPIVLIFFVYRIGGYLGIELAVDFLVFTAVVWNIWVGIYQAFKTIPLDLIEVVDNYRLGFLDKMRKLYIPYSWPRIAANLIPSFADAFFY